VESASENSGRKRCKVNGHEGRGHVSNEEVAENEERSHGASQSVSPMSLYLQSQSLSSASTRPIGRRTKTLSESKASKADMLQHWNQFERRGAESNDRKSIRKNRTSNCRGI
jgi:plasmid maintenance system killer protein